jgi:hypothetical protein
MNRVLVVTQREHCAIKAALKLLQHEIHTHGRILTADIHDLASNCSKLAHLDVEEIATLAEAIDGGEADITGEPDALARSLSLVEA